MHQEKFFNEAAHFYDEMINPERLINLRAIKISKLFGDETISTAADLGCGTGNDTIALAINNIKATGFDISAQMIKAAKAKSQRQGVDAEFVHSDLKSIDIKYNDYFDLAVSFGNALANVQKKDLVAAFKRINSLLKSGKKFLLQILNYDMILRKGERIINITRNGNDFFVRFYDFLEKPGELNFNILRFSENDTKNRELIETKLYPYNASFLKDCLKKCGFINIKVYQDLDKNKFQKFKSKDIIIISEKK